MGRGASGLRVISPPCDTRRMFGSIASPRTRLIRCDRRFHQNAKGETLKAAHEHSCQAHGFLPSNDVVVIVKCPDIEGHTAGKYLVGRHCMERMIVAFVFDATAPFHPVIAKHYRLEPLGGGHSVIDPKNSSIWIGGSSDTYGADPDRELTVQVLTAALPGYTFAVKASLPA